MTEQSRLIGSRYQLQEKIGQGGMALVYRGVDTLTGEVVAIKMLRAEAVTANPDMIERFKREGEALRRLNHPHIVKILDSFHEEDGHYVVMEYVGGGDLHGLIQQARQSHTPLPIERILNIALDLSDGLSRAHRLKIIHRDIKPANVLLAEDGAPRLSDFGVAHFGDATQVLTQTGAMVGTLAYLSPEACAGHELDARADLWAFGVMLYELLTLRRPFEGDTSVSLLHAVLTADPTPVSERRPETPPALSELVDQLLQKKREDRPPSARLVGARLEALIDGREFDSQAFESSAHEASISDEPPPTPSTSQLPTATAAPMPEMTATPPAPTLPLPPMVDKKASARTPFWRSALLALVVTLFLMGLMVVILLSMLESLSEVLNPTATPPSAGVIASTPTLDTNILLVEPVDPGYQMVLVAQMEQVGGQPRDVTRFIVENLQEAFDPALPFSLIRVREYEAVIRSEAEAAAIAEANGAWLILWGDYRDDLVRVQVQLGSLEGIPVVSPRSELERLVNIRLELVDERRESLALAVIGGLNAINTFANDGGHRSGANISLAEFIDDPQAEISGNTLAAQWHRFIRFFITDLDQSLAALNQAIALDADLFALYNGRALIHARLGDEAAFEQDLASVYRFAPAGSNMAVMFDATYRLYFRNDPAAALPLFGQAVAIAPDDWFLLTQLGVTQFMTGDLEGVRVSLERAIANDPLANYPYVMLMALELREGRFAEVQGYLRVIREEYPDPVSATRPLNDFFGLESHLMTDTLAAFGYYTLGQWRSVLELTERYPVEALPDLGVLSGLAHCNLRDYPAAIASYSATIDADPDYWLAYLLRAEAYLRSGDLGLLMEDVSAVLNSPLAAQLTPMLLAAQSGVVTCENFLDVDLAALMTPAGE